MSFLLWLDTINKATPKKNFLFSGPPPPPPSPKTDAGGWLEMVVKAISSAVKKIEAVYFCIVLVLVEIYAGGGRETGN